MARILLIVLAYGALGLAIAGIFLPLLPTVPFLLVSAWAASRSSPRFHRWLLGHPRLGPPIRDWEANRAVSRKSKWSATAAMALGAVLLVLFAQQATAALWALPVMAAVLAWLWMRPEPVPTKS